MSTGSVPRTVLLALFLSILLGVAGQLLLKWTALRSVAPNGADSFQLLMPTLVLALLVYSLGVANWIWALRHLSLSTAYPITSLNYIGILIGSHYWLGESVSIRRAAGVALIFLGVLLVVRGARRIAPGGGMSGAAPAAGKASP